MEAGRQKCPLISQLQQAIRVLGPELMHQLRIRLAAHVVHVRAQLLLVTGQRFTRLPVHLHRSRFAQRQRRAEAVLGQTGLGISEKGVRWDRELSHKCVRTFLLRFLSPNA